MRHASSRSTDYYLQQALANTTQRTYGTAVRSYKEYCRGRGWREDETITDRRLADWLAALADGGQHTFNTLNVYKAALRNRFIIESGAGHAGRNPADSDYLKLVLQGIGRDKAPHEQAKRAAAVKSDPATPAVVMSLAARHPGHLPELCMRYAAMCLGACAGLRPNELLGAPQHRERALRRAQITFLDAAGAACSPGQQPGQPHIIPVTCSLFLPVSKTDQGRRGATRIIAAPFAVKALARWCAHWDQQPESEKTSPGLLFRNAGQPLRTQQLLAHLTAECTAIGMTGFKFTGKCFRRGLASSMAAAGEQPETIKKAGGWRSGAWKYVTTAAATQAAAAASRRLEQGVNSS